jgi:hypothetical protein
VRTKKGKQLKNNAEKERDLAPSILNDEYAQEPIILKTVATGSATSKPKKSKIVFTDKEKVFINYLKGNICLFRRLNTITISLLTNQYFTLRHSALCADYSRICNTCKTGTARTKENSRES